MASGDTLAVFHSNNNEFPSSIPATPDRRNDHPYLEYDNVVDQEAVFSTIMNQAYANNGVTALVHYAISLSTSGTIVIQVAFERIGDQQQDLDVDSFAAFQSRG